MSNAPGLRIESAASVILRDAIVKHMHVFGDTIRRDRAAGQSVTAAYIDGLAGAMALVVAGGHGSYNEVLDATVKTLREAMARDVQHLSRNNPNVTLLT